MSGMQFGIFSVGDVTRDPTTGHTPSENERIKAMMSHQFIDSIAALKAELKVLVPTPRIYRHPLRTGLAQEVEHSTHCCAVFDGFDMITLHIAVDVADTIARQRQGSGERGVVQHQGDFHHHGLRGVYATHGNKG